MVGTLYVARRMAFDALHLCAGDIVADVGCGNGLLTEEVARAVGGEGRVHGIDPSEALRAAAVARCADYSNVSIVDGSADRLPFEENTVDKIVSVQVLEYLPDISAAIREAHRVMRLGGRYVAVDTGCRTLDWFSEDEDRMRRMQQAWDHHYTESRVAALWPGLTREAGFIAVDVEPFTFCDVTLRPDGIAHMMMIIMSRYAVDNNFMDEAESSAWFNEQIELAKQGRFFFSLTYYCMSAIKGH